MRRFLIIIFFSFFWCNAVNSAKATCMGGECEFILSIHYEWAETDCYQTMIMEEVETSFLYFTVVDTGQECRIWDSR